MKNVMLLILSVLVCLSIALLYYSSSPLIINYEGDWHKYTTPPITLIVDGKTIKGTPNAVVINSYPYIPLKMFFESIGYKVEFDDAKEIIKINRGQNELKFDLNKSNKYYVNYEEREMKMPLKLVNLRAMIPIDFVNDVVGMKTVWDSAKRVIKIDSIKVKEVSCSIENTKERVIINTDEPIKNYHFLQSDNAKFVSFEIYSSILDCEKNAFEVGGKVLSRIYAEQVSQNPNIVRVSIDLYEGNQYSSKLSEDGRKLIIEFDILKNKYK